MNNRIKEIRKNLKLNQSDFAKKIGAKQTTVAGWETGARNPSEPIVVSICREFNVNEEWLRTGNGSMFNEIDKESQLMAWVGEILGDKKKSFQKAFACVLAKLDDEQWELIAQMAKSLYEEQQKEQEEQEEQEKEE